jgi:hypothetical protein
VRKNEQKKKRGIDKQSERLFGNLLWRTNRWTIKI